MIKKKFKQRELTVYVFEVFTGDFGFEIRHELGTCKSLQAELFHSISNGVDNMKTLKIAYEMASFAATEVNRFAMNFTSKQEYFQQIIQLTKDINNKLKK